MVEKVYFYVLYVSLKEIVQNGNANILDFKMNIYYECSWKKTNVQNIYASLR